MVGGDEEATGVLPPLLVVTCATVAVPRTIYSEHSVTS